MIQLQCSLTISEMWKCPKICKSNHMKYKNHRYIFVLLYPQESVTEQRNQKKKEEKKPKPKPLCWKKKC